MNLRNRIAQLEQRTRDASSAQCQCPQAAEWPEDVSQVAREWVEGCARCGKPLLPQGSLLDEMREKIEMVYGQQSRM